MGVGYEGERDERSDWKHVSWGMGRGMKEKGGGCGGGGGYEGD